MRSRAKSCNQSDATEVTLITLFRPAPASRSTGVPAGLIYTATARMSPSQIRR